MPAPDPSIIQGWRALMEAHERVMERLRPALRAEGLSISEFDVLVNLTPGRTCRPSDLAERVVLSRTALTRLIDRLVERGLLQRCPDERDRRAVQVGLTPQGLKVRRSALAVNNRVVHACFLGFDRDDAITLAALCRRVGTPVDGENDHRSVADRAPRHDGRPPGPAAAVDADQSRSESNGSPVR